ncbi:MAG: RNA polymerase sigma factor RpoD/SigA [Salinivirgaceae bacterium]
MRQLKITQQITLRSEESINRYFQEVSKYEMISADEEVELAGRIKNKDDAALERLVLANLRFVISVAKQYQNHGLSFSDLINEGNVGLIKAAGKFDATRGFKFISYAVWWIRQSIIQAISEQTRTVRLPLNRLTSINKISKSIPYLEQELERYPTDEEIALYVGIPVLDVAIANRSGKKSVSFDMPVSNDASSDLTLYDLVESNNTPSPDMQLLSDSIVKNIKRAVAKLPDREGDIITKSFGLDSSKVYSLHDIARLYGMSSERVRQIRSKGLVSLRRLLKNKLPEL